LQFIEDLKEKGKTTPAPKRPEMYLYVYWKVDWNMSIISNKLRSWWVDSNLPGQFYNFDLFDNELPEHIAVSQIPALVTFYTDSSF
jgi:hypothetical protein